MKKFTLSLILSVAAAMTASAEYTTDGFYRVHNYDTDRYIYVYDNTGKVDVTGTTVDLYAIQLWKGIDRTISDPGSVLYIEKHDQKYDIQSQGTGIYKMISQYVALRPDTKIPGTYWAYGSSNGLTKYLCDGSGNPDKEQSWMVGEGTSRRNWYITPIDASTDNYFGVTPTVKADDANWAPLYADFSFTFASDGMEAWYVKSIDTKRGLAVMEKIATGAVYNSVPVIIKCASDSKSANRLNLAMKKGENPSDNMLKGVYFNYSDVASHTNRVAYKKETMRVLGVTKDRHLGLVTSGIDYIPRNSFYLPVPAGSPADFRLVTQAEYDELITHEVVEATSVTIDQTTVILTIGESQQLNATVLPADAADKTVTWTSSNTAVATVDANGLVKSVGVGSATITAKCGKCTATCQVIVNPIEVKKIEINPTSMILKVGDVDYIYATITPANATFKTITWSSSNQGVASVDEDGKVTANNVGETVIMASCGEATAFCQVEVRGVEAESVELNSYELSITPGTAIYLYATVKPTDAENKDVVWATSDPEIATVSAMGTVKGIAPGVATITATCGHASAACIVTVEHIEPKSLSVSQKTAEIEVDSVLALTVKVSPKDTTRPVEWTSSDTSIVVVDNDGNVTALAAGVAVVTVTCGQFSDACTITVKDGSGITDIVIDGNSEFDVYNLQGLKVRTGVRTLEGLPAGVYIVNGQKYLVK